MKEITFIRHAKSSWKYSVSDRERPLKTRGFQDIKLVGKEYLTRGYSVENVFSSPAKRAKSTCELFMKTVGISEEKLEIIEELYDFSGGSVANFINSLDDSLDKVMIFGHNHAFTNLVNRYGTTYIDNLPTSGLVVIEFDVTSWDDIEKGKTVLTIFPRDLK